MAHTFTNLLFHVIFSTKDRAPLIDADLIRQLYPYMGGIIRELDSKLLVVNGPADHVHLLVSLSQTQSISDALRILKTNSSRWIHEQWPARRDFAWQTGYGAFSVSYSQKGGVKTYIDQQEEHHRTVTFKEEFVAFLRKHNIEYDERYLWE